jgi:hypothetical protein
VSSAGGGTYLPGRAPTATRGYDRDTAPRRHHTLPANPNRTVGRADAIAAIAARLRLRSIKLLTLTGAGGVGKTRLALEVVRAVEGDFTEADICRRVDGLPLGIELAAARCALLTPAEIAERLDAALGALAPGLRDAPDRQRRCARPSPGAMTCSAPRTGVLRALRDLRRRRHGRSGGDDHWRGDRHARSAAGQEPGRPPTAGARRHPARDARDRAAYAAERLGASADAPMVGERHFCFYLALAQRHGSERVRRRPQGASRGAGRRGRQPPRRT